MLAKMLVTIRENSLISPADRVVVGLSGGPDSVALFHGLLRLREHLALDVSAAHLNHRLRGRDSEGDERFVKELAERHGVALIVGSEDVKSISRKQGGSLEERARELRYRFLREAAGKFGANKIALGHTMDDNAETVLMNFLRGAGLKGLSGIPMFRFEGEFVIIRPLLEVTRNEILSYLRKEKQSYREDASNRDTSFTRNRIRHQLLPLLMNEYNRRIVPVLARTARNLRDAEESVSAILTKLEEECLRVKGEIVSVSLPQASKVPPALRREFFRRLLRDRLDIKVNRGVIKGISLLAIDSRAEKVGLGKGIIACREYDDLLFLPERILSASPFERELRIPCEVSVPELHVRISATIEEKQHVHESFPSADLSLGEIWRRWQKGQTRVLQEVFDASALPGDVMVVRTRREGDTFQPVGMAGKKKLKKLFIDEKVPLTLRGRIPVVCCGNEIMWIAGYRAAAKFAAKETTDSVLRLAVKVLG